MKRLHVLLAAALLAGSTLVSAIPVGPVANPEIYGNWQLTFDVDSSGFPSKGGTCVFTGPMELTMDSPIKGEGDKIPADPVFGEANMSLVSGDCDNFLGDISGNAAGDSIFFVMGVNPVAAKDGGKGGFGISFDGGLVDSTLMEGVITGFVAKDQKGEFGTWRATRSRVVPAVTPAGVLLLLAGLGLAGGIALRRRR